MEELDRIMQEFKLVSEPKNFDPVEATKRLFSFPIIDCTSETKNYHSYHLNRYLITLDELVHLPRNIRVLEIGAPPYGLTLLLKIFLFDDLTATGFEEKKSDLASHIYNEKMFFNSKDKRFSFEFNIPCFNIESHTWPFDDLSFDLIVCSEVLEHLALDPMHVFSEANRVLKGDGHFFVTVPNAIGCSNLARIIRGDQPNSFPPYRPEGINLRHNRELTPDELYELYKAAGFEIESLKTTNVTPPDFSRLNSKSFMLILSLLSDYSNRKDFIMAMGVKKRKVQDRYPEKHQLYFEWDIPRLLQKTGY